MSTEVPPTRCADCGRRYDATAAEPHRCECGGPLELAVDLGVPTELARAHRGLAAVADALVPPTPVDLGAGGTPLVEVDPLDATCKL
ncbi:MAG: hypothetical protein ACLFM8_04055, partial [Halobacteriales archaeon]